MRALLVLFVVLLALALIGSIPVGVDASYDEENAFRLAARVGWFSIRLGKKNGDRNYPAFPKEKNRSGEKASKKRLPPWFLLKILAVRGYAALCRLLSRFRVPVLKLHFTSAFSDPSATAMAYAAAGTAMDGLLRVGGGRLSHPDLWTDVDFDGERPRFDGRICLTLRIHQLVFTALRFGFGVLTDYIRYKRRES